MWLDGIYMACPFLTEFAVTFGEMQWADLAAKQMTLIFDKTRLERRACMPTRGTARGRRSGPTRRRAFPRTSGGARWAGL